ncbi:MAG: 2-oxoacid:acceptor oxidoreductase family protein [Clostridia bacterium]|nr:2-oxoacid:acceptor oxidoreductase family protein [Clostridia bacterium]
MKTSFVFSGSGGQGIMSAGITLAQTAMRMGKHATYLPEYGPEQRGGSAKCTVVISDDPIISPLPRRCDNLIVMNNLAYNKFEEDLKPDGLLLCNASLVSEPRQRDNITVISAAVDDLAEELGNAKAANIVLLGILIGATGIVSEEAFLQSLEDKFKAKTPGILQLNVAALKKGISIGKPYRA